ncbi:MATE family efflux transporter [Rhodobacteraceae bacterium XHP0102]|nr:MATE family efflux transporter [Rhodobacteraceae bacterium XHP0102]
MTALAPLTHRRVLRIAIPVVLSNITVPLLGLVDTGVIGQLGDAAMIGAVGLGAISMTTVFWIFGFLRMGTVGLAAQAHGAGDGAEISALLSRVLMIGVVAGVALILLQSAIFAAVFAIAPASETVEALSRDYMAIRIWSAPAAIAIYGITGWLIAAERTGAVFVLQLWMNGFNILLSLLFVLGLGYDVSGVAAATAIAEWSGLALGLFLCRAAFARPQWRDWPRVFDPARLAHMAQVNTDILIRSVLLMAGFTSFVYIGSDFGDTTLAANQILMQFIHITAYGLDGFAFAAESLVGKALGAKNRAALRQSAKMTALWSGGVALVMALGFWLAGGQIIDILTTAPEVRTEARAYLLWMVLAPLLGFQAWILDGIFIGATRTRDMRNMMALSFVGYVTLCVVLIPSFGNHGLWAALIGMFVLRGLSLGARYPALERAAV